MALLRQGSSYREQQGEVAASVFGIARNLVRRIRRREHGYQSLPVGEGALPASLVSQADSLPTQAVRNELVERVQAAIASLPEHDREVVVLCDLSELS